MNILIIEDENQIALGIKNFLSKNLQSNLITICNNFNKGLTEYNKKIFDIILVDIYLGKNSKSGLDLLKQIKEKDPNIPAIIVSGYQEIHYIKQAFELGANDYIKKPFDILELTLRIKQWLKLKPTHNIKEHLQYKDLILDLNKNEFRFKERPLNLSKKNKQLLKIFINNPETLLSKAYIHEKLWGDYTTTCKNRNLRSNIQNLRKSLNYHCKDWIKTIRGEGYILKKENDQNTDIGR